ncbi:MAG: hypothetical protein KW806_03325 [Candidatus Yanofskybacteria bacterium]|nr:hypothetical protein [Candidatus Yanofskybacteria bacterium]
MAKKRSRKKVKKISRRKKTRMARRTVRSAAKKKKNGGTRSARVSTVHTKELYLLNPEFEFFSELRALVLKASPAEKNNLARRISRLGGVKLAVISGILLNPDNAEAMTSQTDLFIVSDYVDRQRLNRFLKSLEADVGTEIRFGLMDKQEFDYRYGMFDRFVRVLLEGPHEKIINKLGL